MCKEYRALPAEGGINDQDQLLMRQLLIVAKAYKEKEAKESKGKNGTGGA